MSHAEAIQKHNDVLLRCTTINLYVIDFLSAEDVLDEVQEHDIKTERNPLKQRILLFQLLKDVSSHKYESFLHVMKDTEQRHVANLLTGSTDEDHLPLTDARYARLRKIRHKMAEVTQIDIELIAELRSSKAISMTDAEEIRAETVDYAKVSKLISAIMRRSNYSYYSFQEVLRKTLQTAAADFLNEGEMPAVHLNNNRPDLDAPLSLAFNGVISNRTIDDAEIKDLLAEMNRHGLNIAKAVPGLSIVIFIYCKTVHNAVKFTQLFNSGRLQYVLERILNLLLLTIEPHNTESLDSSINLEEEEIIALENFTGIEGWLMESFNRQKPSGKIYGCDTTTQTDEESFIRTRFERSQIRFTKRKLDEHDFGSSAYSDKAIGRTSYYDVEGQVRHFKKLKSSGKIYGCAATTKTDTFSFMKKIKGQKLRTLTRSINPTGRLIDACRSFGVFTKTDAKILKAAAGNWNRQVKLMIKILKRKPSAATHGFLDALEETQQSHIVDALFGKDENLMSEFHQKVLKRCRDTLVKNVVVEGELLHAVISTEAITHTDAALIRAEKGHWKKQADLLVKCLLRRPDTAFNGFIKALLLCDQQHIANALLERGLEVSVRLNLKRRLLEDDSELNSSCESLEEYDIRMKMNRLHEDGLHNIDKVLEARRKRQKMMIADPGDLKWEYVEKLVDLLQHFTREVISVEMGGIVLRILCLSRESAWDLRYMCRSEDFLAVCRSALISKDLQTVIGLNVTLDEGSFDRCLDNLDELFPPPPSPLGTGNQLPSEILHRILHKTLAARKVGIDIGTKCLSEVCQTWKSVLSNDRFNRDHKRFSEEDFASKKRYRVEDEAVYIKSKIKIKRDSKIHSLHTLLGRYKFRIPKKATGSASNINFEIFDFDSEATMENIIHKGAFVEVYGPFRWNSKMCAFKRIMISMEKHDAFNKLESRKTILTSLKHKNLIEIHYVSLKPKTVYIVMEYASGGSLRRLLYENDVTSHVSNWARQIAEGMLYLHERDIVHRDLSSSNILLMRSYDYWNAHTEMTLKIIDFDNVQEYVGTATMSLRGTRSYMAPECLSEQMFSKASDVWSYGVVMWEMLISELPPDEVPSVKNLHSVQLTPSIPEFVPNDFKELVCDCWRDDTRSRPSFRKIIDQLSSIESREDKLPEKYKSDPILVQTIRIKAAEEKNKSIYGLAMLEKELFVISARRSEVEVYDLMKFSFSRRWNLNELIDPADIASCNTNKCLYIFDYKGSGQSKEILRVDPYGKLIKRWSTGYDFGRLSVTDESHVILTVFMNSKLTEYFSDGQLLHEINLSSDAGICYPLHAIKLTSGDFVVSQSYGVCVVDGDGKLKKSFGRKRGLNIGQMNDPIYLAVDGNEFVMVADRENSRVLLLDSDLKFKREILSKERNGLQYPQRILLDKSNDRLFVVDNKREDSQIFIYEFK